MKALSWVWFAFALAGVVFHQGELFVDTAVVLATVWLVGDRVVRELRKP